MRAALSRVALLVLMSAAFTSCRDEPSTQALGDLTSRVSVLEQELDKAHQTAAEAEAELAEIRAGAENLATELEQAVVRVEELERQLASEVDRRRVVELEIENLTRQICPTAGVEVPEGMAEALIDNLISDLRDSGQIGESEPPPQVSTAIEAVVGAEGAWLLVASFDSVFEPAVFFTEGDATFDVLWSGVAGSTGEIWDHIHATAPDVPDDLVRCLDVSRFLGP